MGSMIDGRCHACAWVNRLILSVVGSLVLLVGLATGQSEPIADVPDLKTIIQTLKHWRLSFTNVRLVYESWDPTMLGNKDVVRPSRDDRFNRTEWVWSDIGAIRTEYWIYDDGEVQYRGVTANDGRILEGFRATYPRVPERPGFLEKLHLYGMVSPRPASFHGVRPLHELYRANEAKWLDEVLTDSEPFLEGYEDVEGAMCARLRVGTSLIWLDAGHDFLVRRSRPVDGDLHHWRFDVNDFQRVDGIWFPKRVTDVVVRAERTDTTHWLVTDVAVNQPLDPALFEAPDPMVGTLVVDERSGRTYEYGNREKRPGEARERRIAEEARQNALAMGSPVAIRTSGSGLLEWSAVLLAASMIIFGITVWVFVTRRLSCTFSHSIRGHEQ